MVTKNKKKKLSVKNKIKQFDFYSIVIEFFIISLAIFKIGAIQTSYNDLHMNTYGILKNLVINLSSIQNAGKIEFPYQKENEVKVTKDSLEGAAKGIMKIIGYEEFRCENENSWFSATPLDPVLKLYPMKDSYRGCKYIKTIHKNKSFSEQLLAAATTSNYIELIIGILSILLLYIKTRIYRLNG